MSTQTQPADPTIAHLASGLTEGQRVMLLQILNTMPIEPRNGATRKGLEDRCLIDIIAPRGDWNIALTSLGQRVAECLNITEALSDDALIMLWQLWKPAPLDSNLAARNMLANAKLINIISGENWTLSLTDAGRQVAATAAEVFSGRIYPHDRDALRAFFYNGILPSKHAHASLDLRGLTAYVGGDKTKPIVSDFGIDVIACWGLGEAPADPVGTTPALSVDDPAPTLTPQQIAASITIPQRLMLWQIAHGDGTGRNISPQNNVVRERLIYHKLITVSSHGGEWGLKTTLLGKQVVSVLMDSPVFGDEPATAPDAPAGQPVGTAFLPSATDDNDPESIAHALNPQERLILDELNRRSPMTLTGNQALHCGRLQEIAALIMTGQTITITPLGRALADEANTLEIMGEYAKDPAQSADHIDDSDDMPAPTSEDTPSTVKKSVWTTYRESTSEDPAPSADQTEEEALCPMCGGVGELEATLADGKRDYVPCPQCIVADYADDDAASLIEQLRKEIALLTGALDDDNSKRLQTMREDSAKTLVGRQLAQISKDHATLIRHNRELTARAERAEALTRTLKATQPVGTPNGASVTDSTEIDKLKASINKLEIEIKRQSFNHKRQLDEKDATATKLHREIDTLTTERNEATKQANLNAREFVSQANAAQELREKVETLQAIIERLQPVSGSGTQYRVARDTNEVELEKMHAAGWGIQHMQFMPDGALHVVFVHPGKPQRPPMQPPVYAAATTDTQDAEIIHADGDSIIIGDSVGATHGSPTSERFTEPPTSPTPTPLNAHHVIIIDDGDSVGTPYMASAASDNETDPNGVEAMLQAMRSGVPADQISATLNRHNQAQAREDFTTRQQQAANFAASNPPASRPSPPPRRLNLPG